ncbi:MAG: hypothetical protein ACRD0N_11420 [Acidimicrobiales bacterium]
MSGLWVLVAVPGTCVLLGLVLFMSAYAEQRFLSPRWLVRSAVRARNTPELAEAFVARQFERVLREESAR